MISVREVTDEIHCFYSNGKKFGEEPLTAEGIHYYHKDEVLGMVNR